MPFKFAPTEVMTLGSVTQRNVGDFFPMPPRDFYNPPRTTPQFPQNLMRQTLNGFNRFKGVAFGPLPMDIPVGLDAQPNDPQAASSIPGVTPGSTVATPTIAPS